MHAIQPKLYFHAEGFTASGDLVAHAEQKAAKLFRHLHPRPCIVRLSLKHETPHRGPAHFAACGTTEETGADHVAHAIAAEPAAAISAAFAKLERVVDAAAHMRKHGRRHFHRVDLLPLAPRTRETVRW